MSISVIEYFTQRGALSRVARQPVAAASPARALFGRARQKQTAAEALVSVSAAEAYLLMRDALRLFEEAANNLGDGETLRAKLESLGIASAGCAGVTRAVDEVAKRPFPQVDAEVREEDVETYRQLSEAATVLNRALGETLLSKRDLALRRILRVGLGAAVLLFLTVGLPLLLRPPPVVASAIYSDLFKAEFAIDGKVGTEWILPDATAGWLDVRVSPARPIRLVRVTNGHNRTYNDHAIKAYRVEAYDGDHLVASANGAFTAVTPEPPAEIPLAAAKVDRVRIVVTSWFAYGAALAEIKVE